MIIFISEYLSFNCYEAVISILNASCKLCAYDGFISEYLSLSVMKLS